MGESIVVTGRIGSSPRERGSATGQTCPDILPLEGGATGVIGKVPDFDMSHEAFGAPGQISETNRLVVPATLVYDALASLLQS